MCAKRIRQNKVGYFAVILLVIIIPSCNRGEIFYRFRHIPHAQWETSDAVVFTMDSLSFRLDENYQVSIELTVNSTYPYRDLWLFAEHNLVDTIFRRDSIHLFVMDEFGRRLGSGIGGLRQLSVPFLTNVSLDSLQIYELRISHGMVDNPLRGIERVGVRVGIDFP